MGAIVIISISMIIRSAWNIMDTFIIVIIIGFVVIVSVAVAVTVTVTVTVFQFNLIIWTADISFLYIISSLLELLVTKYTIKTVCFRF